MTDQSKVSFYKTADGRTYQIEDRGHTWYAQPIQGGYTYERTSRRDLIQCMEAGKIPR